MELPNMTGKEAESSRRPAGRGVRAFWWAIGLGGVAALAVAMNSSWRPGAAKAQAPRTAKVTPAAGTPAAGTPAAGTPAAGASGYGKSGAAAPRQPVANTAAANAGGSANAGAKTSSGQRAVQPTTVTGADKELAVVAMVNNEQITRQELAQACLERYGREVLESIVNKHLIHQSCLAKGVTITEQDVNDEVKRIAEKFGLSTDRWLQLLEEERNITPGDYRREIIWPALALRGLASDQMAITAEELKKAFEAEYGEKVRVRVISVSSRKKAEELHRKAVAAPEDFGTLAKDNSEDSSASVMGLVPPVRRHVGDATIEKMAFSLKKGEISPIIPIANQHLIMKCEEHMEATYLGGPQLKQAQEKLKDRIRDQKTRSVSAELFKKLQDQARIDILYGDAAKQKQQPGVAATVNGHSITVRQLSEECITRHGMTVLDGEINRRILTQELKKRKKAVDDNDIQEEVARAADSYGYLKPDGSPDIDAWLKNITEKDGATVDLYVRDAVWPSAALKKLAGNSVTITEDDLQRGFESNYGERVEVLAIVLGNQRQAQQVWEMARDNPTNNFFGELASQYSIEPSSRSNFGKVPPVRRHGGQPLLEETAFRMKPGELSSIVSMNDKFIIMRCLGRTKPVVTEFTEEVRKELVKDLVEKKSRLAMSKEFDRLKEVAQVDNFMAGTTTSGKPVRGNGTASPAAFVAPSNPAIGGSVGGKASSGNVAGGNSTAGPVRAANGTGTAAPRAGSVAPASASAPVRAATAPSTAPRTTTQR
jgi:parvulin-like peptidyl-prolyl isomerase